MAFLFDFENTLINVVSPTTEFTCQELIDAIRTAEVTGEGIQYSKIADASGKESLGGGVAVGITVELLGNWQVKFWEGNYIAKITGGNLVGGPAGDPVAYSAGVQTLLIQSAAGTITTISTGSGLSESQDETLTAISNNVGTIKTDTEFIKDIEGGKWTIVNDQMVFFKADNMTEIARFDLYDADGNATMTNVMSRERL